MATYNDKGEPKSVTEVLRFREGLGYTDIVDATSSSDYIYYGYAQRGAATSEESWRIERLTISNLQTLTADGNDLLDNEWDERTSLSYS